MRPADSRQGVRLTPDDIAETAARLLAIMEKNPQHAYTQHSLGVFVTGAPSRVLAGLRLLATQDLIEPIPLASKPGVTLWRMKTCDQK